MIFNSYADAIFIYNDNWQIIYVNSSAKKLMGQLCLQQSELRAFFQSLNQPNVGQYTHSIGIFDYLTSEISMSEQKYKISFIHSQRISIREQTETMPYKYFYPKSTTEKIFNFNSVEGFKIQERIKLVANTDCSVLITGETGTGKEGVARQIHMLSDRKNKPLVIVNCAAIPNELFESEFFGYVKGAFTGALRDHTGYFQQANGGTLFLDEIGEMPLVQQSKLLRVLQDQEVRPVGSQQTFKINTRLLAATNRDLKKETESGQFRMDLYYRINVIPIEIPPLRGRLKDIEQLAQFFIESEMAEKNLNQLKVDMQDWQKLLVYPWPGNIRQLKHEIERAILMAMNTGQLHFFDLDKNYTETKSPQQMIEEILEASERIKFQAFPLDSLKKLERELIRRALETTGGKIYGQQGAAHLLKIKGTTLASKIQKLGINL